MEGVDIKYVIGDVTRPQVTGAFDSLVLHCVGEERVKWDPSMRMLWGEQ